MINKKVWFFHHTATPPTMSGLTRPYYFSLNLKNKQYKSKVFAASYLHYSDINLINDKSEYIVDETTSVPFIFVNTPSSKKSTFTRVLNMIAFYRRLFSVAKKFAKREGRPDLIIASSPHPLAMIAGIKIAQKFKIPCICEIRDLWPDAIFAFGKTTEKSILGKLLIKGEHWIYKKADALIFLKEGDTNYLKEKKWTLEQGGDIDLKKCFYINNGVDLENFTKQIIEKHIEDPDLKDENFKVVYAGAIRPVNNVGNILDAASMLKNNKDIQFLIYGDGNQIEQLKQRINDEKLTNVKMKGYIDKKYIPFILNKSSVNLLNYSQTKYNWTRGNSSNKLFEYMASGKPIISTVRIGYCPLEKYKCGISLDKDTPEELAKAVMKVYEMPRENYDAMCKNAKDGSKDFDFKILTEKLISVMESLI
jgi:glycosyltransferase involved in cell wall biosynthesis